MGPKLDYRLSERILTVNARAGISFRWRRHSDADGWLGKPIFSVVGHHGVVSEGLPRIRHDKELSDYGAQRIRESLEHGDRRVLQPSFKPTYVCPVDPGVDGEMFL